MLALMHKHKSKERRRNQEASWGTNRKPTVIVDLDYGAKTYYHHNLQINNTQGYYKFRKETS
jgi:hypothetical protein